MDAFIENISFKKMNLPHPILWEKEKGMGPKVKKKRPTSRVLAML